MKLLVTVSILLFSIQTAQSQNAICDYIPLEFEEVNPTWRYLVVDSTFIGHVDTSLETGAFQQYYLNGMDQLGWDNGSFVKNGHLYSITEVKYDLDLSGYYIEKINLDTGETDWKVRTDLRFEKFREKSLGVKVKDGKFIMFGVRTFFDELQLTYNDFAAGLIPSVFFFREYNDTNGELISYFSPSEDEETSALINSYNNGNYFYEKDENDFIYIKKNANIFRGIFFERTIVNRDGIKVSEKDTVITGSFNDINYQQTFFQAQKGFHKDKEGDYYVLEQVLPLPDSNLERRGIITKYDVEFNKTAFWDIYEIDIPEYSLLTIAKEIDDKIILKGCLNTHPGAFCKIFYVVLDKNLNYLYHTIGMHDDNYLLFIENKSILLNDNDQIIVFDRILNEEGQSYLTVYQSNDSGTMDSLQRLTISEEEWVGFVNTAIQLDNGDYLVKINHSCYIDGDKRSWFPEWLRFAKDDIETLSATSDLGTPSAHTLYPNPTTGDLFINVEDGFIGQLIVTDVTGTVVKLIEQKYNSTQIKTDVSMLTSGTYFLVLKSKVTGLSETLRFVKI